jgi:5'-deoxynucleotidase YfbR-like HD superfamily hydrolase
MMPTTNAERVTSLIRHSDRVYDTIDQSYDNEVRYRRILRIGVNTVALSLRSGAPLSETGAKLRALPNDLPPQTGPLDTLANLYADIERATLDRDGKHETDARHAVHLMRLAVPYAGEFYPKLDANKIAAYALIHDIVEAYADDTPSLGITPEQKKQKDLNEALAIKQLYNDYHETWPELIELIEAYEALTESEARFVKTFDKLDPSFTHFYNKGHQLTTRYGYKHPDEFLDAIHQTTRRMSDYSSEFPLLMQDREGLIRRVADVAFSKAA